MTTGGDGRLWYVDGYWERSADTSVVSTGLASVAVGVRAVVGAVDGAGCRPAHPVTAMASRARSCCFVGTNAPI